MRNFVITVNGKAYQVGVEEVGATASYVTPVAPVADAQPAAPVFPVGKSAAPSVAGETPAATPYPAADAATTGAVNETPRATGLETPNLDAPKPKKKKTGLIVGLIIAALAIAGIAFALTQMGSCSGIGDEGQIKAAVDSAMNDLAHPTEESKAELAEGISEGFEMTAGFDLEDLGITADEYADWVLGGITYEVGETQFDAEKGTGTAAVTVNSRDMNSFNKNFEEEIIAMSNAGLGDVDSYEALYAKIGEAMRTAMEKTAAAETQVTFDLTKGDDGWAVNDDSKEACYSQILAGNNA